MSQALVRRVDPLAEAQAFSDAFGRVMTTLDVKSEDFQLIGPAAREVILKKRATLFGVPMPTGSAWYHIHESYAGAWQRNDQPLSPETVLAHAAVFACITLIASDCGKMRLRLVREDSDGIWTETENPAWSPVLRSPNHFQTRQKFIEGWMTSKLTNGNTYVLKRRDARGVVNALYVLDPHRVTVLVAPDGSVFYELATDHLSGLQESSVIVPAREIIHDIYWAPAHHLVGLSPIAACGYSAQHGLNIQDSASSFFANGSTPGAVLTAAGAITQEQADRIEAKWQQRFSGVNSGKVAVLGGGLTYVPMTQAAADSQLIEQWKWTFEMVCVAFRVPPHKINIGQPPNYNNAEVYDRQYFSQNLHEKIECIEALLDKGLELPRPYGTEFLESDLLRMDSSTQMKTIKEGVNAGVLMPNEGRAQLGIRPVDGGETPYLQAQYWPLSQLSSRTIPDGASPNTQAQNQLPEKAISVELASHVKSVTPTHILDLGDEFAQELWA